MERTQKIDEQLAALASHIAERRTAILRAWRDAVDRDPELTTASSLPRAQFNDHIPQVLDAFEGKLKRPCLPKDNPGADMEPQADAAAHGLQRWQQGYHLREVTREWGRLHLCLADELADYAAAHPGQEAGVMSSAWKALAALCSEGISDSTTQYFHLQQMEASGHVRDLKKALDEVREMERDRAELWRQAAHDLRGNLGVVTNATAGLALKGVPESTRDRFFRMLQKNVSSLHSMLDDVISLARLQAGHEQREVKPIDAAALLRDVCENLQELAAARGLFLKTEGPDSLPVEGDAIKIRRIVQNLLLNALKYTHQGGVTMSWGDSRKSDPERWMLTVQDTGPGFHAGPGAPLAGALEEATEEARHVDEKDRTGRDAPEPVHAPPAAAAPRPIHQEQGEGIGLSIVKRLCELLDAGLELESAPGVGTTLRVVLPRHYAANRPKPPK